MLVSNSASMTLHKRKYCLLPVRSALRLPPPGARTQLERPWRLKCKFRRAQKHDAQVITILMVVKERPRTSSHQLQLAKTSNRLFQIFSANRENSKWQELTERDKMLVSNTVSITVQMREFSWAKSQLERW